MPNRFTAQLDALVPLKTSHYISWSALDKILPKRLIDSLFKFRLEFSSMEHFTSDKTLILCFIAEMSDEDLMEVFGI